MKMDHEIISKLVWLFFVIKSLWGYNSTQTTEIGQMTDIDTWNGKEEKFSLCLLISRIVLFVEVFQCSKETILINVNFFLSKMPSRHRHHKWHKGSVYEDIKEFHELNIPCAKFLATCWKQKSFGQL